MHVGKHWNIFIFLADLHLKMATKAGKNKLFILSVIILILNQKNFCLQFDNFDFFLFSPPLNSIFGLRLIFKILLIFIFL